MKFRGKASLVLAMGALAALPSAAAAGDQLWWSNYGASVSKVNLVDSVGANVFSGSPVVNGPYGTAADPSTGRIFWINYSNGRLYAGNLDGSGAPQLVTSSHTAAPSGLASDPSRNQLFWIETGTKKVWRIGMDGAGATDIFTEAQSIGSPVVDPGAGQVFWIRYSTPRTIRYGSVNGGTPSTIEVPADCPYYASTSTDAFSVDVQNGFIYMGTTGHPITQADIGIARMNLDGTNCVAVTTATQTPSGLALDPDNQKLYWADYNSSRLRYVSLNPPGGQQTLTPTGAALSSPSYPVLIKAPAGSAAVTPSSAEPGATLTCSPTWSQGAPAASMYRAPQSTAYSWTQDGQPIAGAASSTLVADSAGDYACTATGTNAAGSTAVTSAAVTVRAPTPPIPPLPPLPPIPTPPNTFTVTTAGSNSSSLRTRVTVPGPGTLRQRGVRASGTRSSAVRSACTGSRDVPTAGTYSFPCRTSAATRRAQRRGKVRIVLTTSFTPTGGTTASSSRTVTLPALKPRYTG